MMGVTLRAYPAAAVLFDAIQVVAGKQPEGEGTNDLPTYLPPKNYPNHAPGLVNFLTISAFSWQPVYASLPAC